jgi:hypothetical protein
MLRRTSANTDRRSRTLEAAFCSPAATFAFQRAAAGLTLPAYFFGSPAPVFRPVRLRSPTPAFLEKIRGALQPEPVASPTCAVSSPATGPPLPSGESPLGIEALNPAPNRRAYRNAQPAFPSLPVGLCLIFSLRITVPGSLPYVRFQGPTAWLSPLTGADLSGLSDLDNSPAPLEDPPTPDHSLISKSAGLYNPEDPSPWCQRPPA